MKHKKGTVFVSLDKNRKKGRFALKKDLVKGVDSVLVGIADNLFILLKKDGENRLIFDFYRRKRGKHGR